MPGTPGRIQARTSQRCLSPHTCCRPGRGKRSRSARSRVRLPRSLPFLLKSVHALPSSDTHSSVTHGGRSHGRGEPKMAPEAQGLVPTTWHQFLLQRGPRAPSAAVPGAELTVPARDDRGACAYLSRGPGLSTARALSGGRCPRAPPRGQAEPHPFALTPTLSCSLGFADSIFHIHSLFSKPHCRHPIPDTRVLK